MDLLKLLRQKGKSLVLKGPDGCVKSRLARKMLARRLGYQNGSYSWINIKTLVSEQGFNEWLLSETVIVEGLPDSRTIHAVKELICNDKIKVNVMFKDPFVTKTPNFIFCTGSVEPLKFGLDDRRFHVIDMETEQGRGEYMEKFGRLLCWLGLHSWVHDVNSVRSCGREGCLTSQWLKGKKWKEF